MIRIIIVCEGQTEEAFINKILVPFFAKKSIYLSARLIGKPGHKGGNITYQRVITDIKIILKSDKSCYCTTFFDYYGIDSKFPGKEESKEIKCNKDKQKTMHEFFTKKVHEDLNNERCRFLPYIVMHEFEGLLFSSPELFAKGINDESLAPKFAEIVRSKSPEEINDNPSTAPSKRILSIKHDYDKPRDGLNAALEIGLNNIRRECPLFDTWIKKLESLKDEK